MARFGTVARGEGPYYFVKRVVGPNYARRWKQLRDVNPGLRLNKAGDNFTASTWTPGLQVRIPDAWPGGESSAVVGYLDTV